jgi:hypothetical protein
VDRHTFFEIHEPMFRFWIEYRTADWSDTRIAWLTRDLEWLWTPAEVARAWLGDHEPDAQIAAERVVRRNPASARVVVDVATEELRAALRGGERFKTAALWARIASLDAGPAALLELATRFLSDGETHFLPDRTDGLNPQARLVYRAIQRLGASSGGRRSEGPKASTVSLALAARRGAEVDLALPDAIGDAVIRAIERVDPRGGQWKLSESDRRALAGAPWLRVNFLRRGRVWSHPALLTSADVLPHLRKRDGDLGALLTIAHAWEDVGLFTVSAIRLAEGEGLLPW